VKGKVVEKEDPSQFEPFKNRYRRATGSIDPNKLSCTLKMRVSLIQTYLILIILISTGTLLTYRNFTKLADPYFLRFHFCDLWKT